MTVDAEGLQIPAELQRDMEALEGLARDGEVSEADLDALRQDVDQLLDAETGVGAELRARATGQRITICLLYTSPSPRDQRGSRMPSSA